MSPLRIGLIGVGKHGVRYARHIAQDLAGEARLVAIARRDPRRVQDQAAEFGCRGYVDYRDLIAAPDVDAIVVVVPPTLHPDVCAAVVAAGKPALFEKPAAAAVDDARRMLAMLSDAKAPIMVAQTLRYNAVVNALLAALDDIGAIHSLRLSQRFEPSPLGWIDVPEISGGGMILHTGVHSFDLVRRFTGSEVDKVACASATVFTERTEDNFVAALRLRSGGLASVAGSRATRSRSGPIEIAGANGTLIGDHVLGTAMRVTGTTATPLDVGPTVPTVREVVRDFVGCIRCELPLPIPFVEGLRAAAIAVACIDSARLGRWVEVDPLGAPAASA